MDNKKLHILIVLLIGIIIWFGAIIAKLENYRYAVQVGFCSEFNAVDKLIERNKCLEKTETRTNSFWHLFYALK
ncbi:MAG: hypothetical protein ACD_37C00234G0006 [uncultured bacterium]|nr:MAG: hypothetical protein ACD_37C00234G0006 [uncultured bacterium]